MMTKRDVLVAAQVLFEKLNTEALGHGEDPIVVLLALRMFETFLTSSMRSSPEGMALVSELWGIIEPAVKLSCAEMGMAPGED